MACRIVIIGESGVGKTSIVSAFTDPNFDPSTPAPETIGTDGEVKAVKTIDGTEQKIVCFDTAGQEKFRHITASFYNKAHCVIIVYDVTRKETAEKIEFWRSEAQRYKTSISHFLVIGNKTDLTDKVAVSTEEGQAYAEKVKAHFVETNIFNVSGIESAILDFVKETVADLQEKADDDEEDEDEESTHKKGSSQEGGSGCCTIC